MGRAGVLGFFFREGAVEKVLIAVVLACGEVEEVSEGSSPKDESSECSLSFPPSVSPTAPPASTVDMIESPFCFFLCMGFLIGYYLKFSENYELIVVYS
jgi:hypothetical protein